MSVKNNIAGVTHDINQITLSVETLMHEESMNNICET